MKISIRSPILSALTALLVVAGFSCRQDKAVTVDITLDGPAHFAVSTEAAGSVERLPGKESFVTLSLAIRARDRLLPGGGLRIEQGRLFNGRPLIGADLRYALGDPVLGPGGAANLLTVATESSPFEVSMRPAGLGRYSPEIVFPEGLPAGEKVTVLFGDRRTGGPGMKVPPIPLRVRLLCYADRAGDGLFLLAHGPHPLLESHAVEADRLRVVVPSVARPGRTTVRIVPVRGGGGRNASSLPVDDFTGEVVVCLSDEEGAPHIGRIDFERGQTFGDAEVVLEEPGLYRLSARSVDRKLRGTSNPILVSDGNDFPVPEGITIRWGSIQSHTAVGGHAAALQDEAYDFARGAACLDFCSISDHSSNPSFCWEELRLLPDRFDDPGSFVALAGYEWTSESHGHRHVILKDARGVIAWSEVPTDDPGTRHAPTLADLAEKIGSDPNVLIVVHHTTWLRDPAVRDYDFGLGLNLDRQRLFEVYSWHGLSEFNRSPLPIHGDSANERRPGSSFRDVLAAGGRYCVTADSDGHVGLPGVPIAIRREKGLRYGFSGVTAVYADSFDRAGIFSALERGRCYGTTGARIVIALRIDNTLPGGTVKGDGQPHVQLTVHGTDAIDSVQLLRDGQLLVAQRRPGELDFSDDFTLSAEPVTGRHSYYLRVEQADGHMAWVSPIWIEWEE